MVVFNILAAPKLVVTLDDRVVNCRDDNAMCAVATGVKFLLVLSSTMRSRSAFLREILRILDRFGVCQCIPMASMLVPLLCNLSKWNEKTQNLALAIVGKILLFHYHKEERQAADEYALC